MGSNCAGYLSVMLNPSCAAARLDMVMEQIEKSKIQFDSIACRGVSGLLCAPILAHKLHKHLIVVRKGEDRHSSFDTEYEVPGYDGQTRYIIVDDLIESGATMQAIIENAPGICVGIFLFGTAYYCSSRDYNWYYLEWEQELLTNRRAPTDNLCVTYYGLYPYNPSAESLWSPKKSANRTVYIPCYGYAQPANGWKRSMEEKFADKQCELNM